MTSDAVYYRRCAEAAIATRKLADLRAFFSSGRYHPTATLVLEGIELDACCAMSGFIVNPYSPVDWSSLIDRLEQLRQEAICVHNADIRDLPAMDLRCLDEAIAPAAPIVMDLDPSIVDDREVHEEYNTKHRNHSRRHVYDRLCQLLGEQAYGRRMCKEHEASAIAAIAGYATIPQCREALSAAGMPRLYPHLAYLRSFHGHARPYVSSAELKALVARTLQLVTVSAQYRHDNGWCKKTDRSFYGYYAVLALPEIVGAQRAAEIAPYMMAHEPRLPPVTIDELRAAVIAAERC